MKTNKNLKKLMLSKETVATLSAPMLNHLVGGYKIQESGVTACVCNSIVSICWTCEPSCACGRETNKWLCGFTK